MTRKQMERFFRSAIVLITLHWLLTLPFSNTHLEGMWPPALTEEPNRVWAVGVVAVSIALGVLMLWFARSIRRTLSASEAGTYSDLQPSSWAMFGYATFVIMIGVFVAATLDQDVFNAVRVPVYGAILLSGGIFVSAGTLFLWRIRDERLSAEWKMLFLEGK